jgi:hypothetical protein
MVGLIMKLIACPIILLASNYFFGLGYTLTQIIVVGIILAVIAHLMEVLLLKRGTFWVSTVSDFIAAFLVVYLSQYFLANVTITFLGALLTAIIVTVVEYFVHQYLINSGKTKKGGE